MHRKNWRQPFPRSLKRGVHDMERVSVKEAAHILGLSEDYVRYALRRGELPIGRAIKGKGRHYIYLIYRDLLRREIGE